MLITVSGPPGSGKSTAASGLADAFDLDHVSGGDVFRDLAAERGYSLAEFNARAEEDDQIDRDLDRRLREVATEQDGVVIESRLAGWMAGDHATLKVWLDAPVDVRAARIADREDTTVEAAREATLEREASETQRYAEYYGIDFADRSIYDLAVNTARWGEDAMVDLVVAAVEAYDPATDEGAVPVRGVDYDF
ncbi:MAG: (d)CMP kinase [Halobacteriaceae archaeon]